MTECDQCGFPFDPDEHDECPECGEPTEAYDDADLKYDIWRDRMLEAAADARKRRKESGDG